jgi:hypothetical protein
MKWNEMKWTEMKWNAMEWNEMKWTEMTWNGMKLILNDLKWTSEIKRNGMNLRETHGMNR